MVTLKCKRCRRSYTRRPSHVHGSKFCSRRCHDLGKEYSDGRGRGSRTEARKLRRKGLTAAEIATRLGVAKRTVIVYVKGIPLSRRALRTALQKSAETRWAGHKPRTNRANKQRLAKKGIVKCQIRGCRWRRTLELHHEPNGDLKVLCPNHHSLTPNWKRKTSAPVAKR
jgi:predicted transcriptional regulator